VTPKYFKDLFQTAVRPCDAGALDLGGLEPTASIFNLRSNDLRHKPVMDLKGAPTLMGYLPLTGMSAITPSKYAIRACGSVVANTGCRVRTSASAARSSSGVFATRTNPR